ncbi:MAG: hypothetical protein Q8873_03065 [Bacillota bacterium]|nr:hypothetical protein [Bacillota bacterium]
MAYLNEKVSYLKGLSAGLGISDETAEGKLLNAIIEVMQEISDEVEVVTGAQDELAEEVAGLIEEVYAEDDFDDDDDDYFEVKCENCGNIIAITNDMFEGDEKIVCPTCGEPIEIDFCCDCDGEDCENCGE